MFLRKILVGACAVCVCLSMQEAAFAQSNAGSVSGVVTDTTKAVLAGAEVTATNMDSGARFASKTNGSGAYTIPSLQPGRYSVQFTFAGFQTYVREIVLDATQKGRLDAELQPGSPAKTTVVVQDTVPLINTETGDIGKTVESRLLRDMPVKGRAFYQILQLVPGITARSYSTNELDSPGVKYGDSSISGSRPNTNVITQDGVGTNQATGFANSPYGPLEPIQEVRVLTNSYSAEYGRSGGAQIALQTKSGGRNYHGAAYGYFRNGVLNANRWENNAKGLPRQDYNWEQLGGSIGGPIPFLRKKAFFYSNYETERGTNPAYPTATVAPMEIRNGDFSSLAPFGVRIIDPLTRKPFPGNIIPASRIDPAALKITALVPQPNAPGILQATSKSGIPGSNYIAPTFQVEDPINSTTDRVDLYPNDSNRVYVAYQYFREGPDTNSTALTDLLDNTRLHREGDQYRVSVGYTHLFSPRISNESLAAFQFYRRTEIPPNGDGDLAKQLGIQSTFGHGVPLINFSGSLTSFGRNAASAAVEFPITLSNYTTSIFGDHTFKFGAAVERYLAYSTSVPNSIGGSYSFTGEMSSTTLDSQGNPSAPGRGNEAYSYADFLLGTVQSASVDFGLPEQSRSAYNLGLFVNDDWKIARRLTLNLGLRYDFETRITTKNNLYSRIDPLTGALLVAGRNGVSDTLNLKPTYGNFAPRLGFAYSVNQKTVVRSGFGLFYGSPWIDQSQTTPGFSSSQSIPGLGTGNPQPFSLAQGIPSGDLSVGLQDPFNIYNRATVANPFSGATTLAGNEPMPYNMNWNLSVSRQLPFSSVVEVAYVANHGVHLAKGIPGNNPLLEQAAAVNKSGAQAYRPFPNIGSFDVLHYNGNSWYNSLQTKFSRRFSRGLAVDLVYTFSKMTDDGSVSTGATSSRSVTNEQAPWEYPNIERGLSDYDRTHVFTVAWVAELPFGKGRRFAGNTPVLSRVIGGFQLSGTFNYQTGEPYTISETKKNTTLSTQRPNVTDAGNLSGMADNPAFALNSAGAPIPAFQWLIPTDAAGFPFADSGPLAIGNLGRNTTRGPATKMVDLALFREFALTEQKRLQFRAEVFNALNLRVLRGLNSTDIVSTSYGQITGTLLPRTFQLGLRFNF